MRIDCTMENRILNLMRQNLFMPHLSTLSRSPRLLIPQTRSIHQSLNSPSYHCSFSRDLSKPTSLSYRNSQIGAFHTSARRLILPPLPQVIQGTANDPAPVPESSPMHGSYHWVFERAMSALLIPLTVAPFAAGTLNPITDAILCAAILIHTHIGFQSVIIDYIPTHRLPITRKVFWWGLRLATLVVGVGFYEFETNDVGLTEGIKRIWQA